MGSPTRAGDARAMATRDADAELVHALFDDLRDTVRDATRSSARGGVGSFEDECARTSTSGRTTAATRIAHARARAGGAGRDIVTDEV